MNVGKGLTWFFLGLMAAVATAVVYERLQSRQVNADWLSDRIGDRLDELEDRLGNGELSALV